MSNARKILIISIVVPLVVSTIGVVSVILTLTRSMTLNIFLNISEYIKYIY